MKFNQRLMFIPLSLFLVSSLGVSQTASDVQLKTPNDYAKAINSTREASQKWNLARELVGRYAKQNATNWSALIGTEPTLQSHLVQLNLPLTMWSFTDTEIVSQSLDKSQRVDRLINNLENNEWKKSYLVNMICLIAYDNDDASDAAHKGTLNIGRIISTYEMYSGYPASAPDLVKIKEEACSLIRTGRYVNARDAIHESAVQYIMSVNAGQMKLPESDNPAIDRGLAPDTTVLLPREKAEQIYQKRSALYN